MISLEPIEGKSYIIRICLTNDEYSPFIASGVLEYKNDNTWWIKGLNGIISRTHMKELVLQLDELGITKLYSIRLNNHRIPMSFVNENGITETDIQGLAKWIQGRENGQK